VGLGFDVGRADDESHLLRGMGNIPAAPTLKAFAEYVIFPVVVRISFRRAIGGFDGYIGDLGAYVPVAGNEKFALFVGPSLSFADEAYMRRYFGITRSQAAASGYPIYHPRGGAKEVAFGASADWFFAENWLVDVDGAAKRLFDRASHSPIVHAPMEYVLSFSVAYQY
jgi:outer membrane scaffolding protein for murein synthesis (MipA/OmpV family)